jgi:hypothetical protein
MLEEAPNELIRVDEYHAGYTVGLLGIFSAKASFTGETNLMT